MPFTGMAERGDAEGHRALDSPNGICTDLANST